MLGKWWMQSYVLTLIIVLFFLQLSGMAFGDTKENFKKTKSVYLGLAVYPTVSFSNHSCYPAVGR